MDSAISKKTQDTLGKIIKKPPLTEKLLSKPPFRFLHDIMTSVIKTTGFMKGLYSEADMNSDNVKDKDAKVAFLQKAIDMVAAVTGKGIVAKPIKIVAGHEPERTNEFLQVLAAAINAGVNNDEYVKKVLSGGGSTGKEVKKEGKPEKREDKERSHSASRRKDDKESKPKEKSQEREQVQEKKPKERDGEGGGAGDEKDRDRQKDRREKSRERDDRHKDRDRDKDRDRRSRKTAVNHTEEAELVSRPSRATGAVVGGLDKQRKPGSEKALSELDKTKSRTAGVQDKSRVCQDKPKASPATQSKVAGRLKTEGKSVKTEGKSARKDPHVAHSALPLVQSSQSLSSPSQSRSQPLPLPNTRVGSIKAAAAEAGGERSKRGPTETALANSASSPRTGNLSALPPRSPPKQLKQHLPASPKKRKDYQVPSKISPPMPKQASSSPALLPNKAKVVVNLKTNLSSPDVTAQQSAQQDVISPAKSPKKSSGKQSDCPQPESLRKLNSDIKAANKVLEQMPPIHKEKTTSSESYATVLARGLQVKESPTDKADADIADDKVTNSKPDDGSADQDMSEAGEILADSTSCTSWKSDPTLSDTGPDSVLDSPTLHADKQVIHLSKSRQRVMFPGLPHIQESGPEKASLDPAASHLSLSSEEGSSKRKNLAVKGSQSRVNLPVERTPPERKYPQPQIETEEKENDAPEQNVEKESSQETPSRLQRPTSAKGSRRRRQGREARDDEDEEFQQRETLEPTIGENDLPPQIANARKLARPPSARPAPPRPKQEGLEAEPAMRLGTGAPANLIIDDGKQDDDEENFLVEEAAPQPPPTVAAPVQDSGDDNVEHGALVKKMLESKEKAERQQPKQPTKKTEIERPSVSDAQRRKQRELVAKEIERLQSSIQALTRSANPLGKIMDYVQEDMDSMQKELDRWRAENKEHALALRREKNVTDRAIEPLKAQLTDLDRAISDQLDLIAACKSNILRNDSRIQKMLQGVARS